MPQSVLMISQIYYSDEMELEGEGIGATVWLLYYDLGAMVQKHENNLFIYEGKAAFTLPRPKPTMVKASCTGLPYYSDGIMF